MAEIPGNDGDLAPGDATDDTPAPRWPAAVLAAVGLLVAADLATDAWAGGETVHVIFEVIATALALGGAAVLWRHAERRRLEARALARGLHAATRDLEAARAEAARWRGEAAEALRGLGEAIDKQCDRWGLSPAEREVALLLLKGLSHKEIAQVRGTSERTVRQQALVVYRKAGLAGRAELAAFFLEDLLLPAPRA